MNYNNCSGLSNHDINRYSRQIILKDVGCEGQLNLRNASVLIVGVGGLGCPCGLYLAGSGIGHIGLVDYDLVELNNLHRQILHKESTIGSTKVDSASAAIKDFNHTIKVSNYCVELNSANAINIVNQFDVVVDASDNVATRYLLNDAAYLCKKPLVSGSALQMEGQLTVYNHEGGPCYRCLFPIPPAPETVTNCGEGGVLGVIPGTIGVLQALQVLNLLLRRPTLSKQLLLFDGADCSFRRVRLRGKSPQCDLCGDNPTITNLIDYETFCKSKANDKNPNLSLLRSDQRISVTEYAQNQSRPHLLVDVRSPQEFQICKLPEAMNIQLKSIETMPAIESIAAALNGFSCDQVPVYVVCRRGNDSQKAVLALEKALPEYVIKDIVGGLHAWTKEVDPTFPLY